MVLCWSLHHKKVYPAGGRLARGNLLKAAALALVALAVAGCLAPGATTPTPDVDGLLSQVLYPDTLAEHTPIQSFDGVTLDAWVYRPDVGEAGEKVPVIINFSPYWSNLAPAAATGGDAFSLYLLDYFVPRGYAVALVSARGTGLSEGCFTIGGPVELQDEDLVATFLAEQPWSNGNVTATGKSYDGTMAQGLLTRGNPHVKTIAPVSPISEFYKYNYFDGVPYPNGFVTNEFNTNYVVAVSLAQSQDPRDPTFGQTPSRICKESLDVQASQYEGSFAGDYSPYWQARNYSALLPETVDASVFYIHGLHDFNVKPDHMVPWVDELRARNVPLKMWLGDWQHEYPTRPDFNQTLLRWFDHYLKGIDTGILQEPAVNVESRDDVWRTENEWPPARATPLVLYPDAGGALSPQPGTGSASYPDRPALPASPVPQAAAYEFTAPRDRRIVGAPSMRVAVSATGPRATLSATLLADGEVVGQGFRDLAHRSSLDKAEPMTPGQRYEVDVHFFPQDVLVKAGTKLTLVLSHRPWGADPLTDATPVPTAATVTVLHGETTWLSLPVIDANDVTPEPEQPKDVGCWAC